jgi:hypothetical protein
VTPSTNERDSFLIHKPFWIAALVVFVVTNYWWGSWPAAIITVALVIVAMASERARIRDGARRVAVTAPTVPDGLEMVQFPTGLPVAVVGESHFQDALERLCGGRDKNGAQNKCVALLVPEDANPFDPEAVRVDIGGLAVGYLSRAAAKRYRPIAEQLRSEGKIGAASAIIVGGWDRGDGDRGHFGVKLDMNPFAG